MKRIIAATLIVFLLLPGLAAAASGDHGSPGGEQRLRAEENATPHVGENIPDREWMRMGENETSGGRYRLRFETPQEVYRSPDRYAENRTGGMGGMGENISVIAREFSNSAQKTFEAEERIRARHGFTRFLFGGDTDAARLIEGEAQRNRERATELRRLIGNCTCDNETRTMLQEQVRTIEQEQDRLRTLASEEMQVRGLFSWR